MNASNLDERAAGAVDEPATSASPNSAVRDWRRPWRRPLMLLGPVIVIVAAAYFYLTGGRYETTDDAYVQIARIDVSANVPGRVLEIAVHDNQAVRKGDILFRLDDAPFSIAVQEANAQLAAARLQIESLKATYQQRRSDLASAQATLAFQQREYDRQQRLLGSGISSQLQVDRALHGVEDARAQVAGTQQQIAAIVASLGGDPNIAPERHPTVQQAQALLDRAQLNLSYTVVKAPGDGIVTRVEQLQVGTYISASTPVFALVSTNDIWVEANFKENQLTYLRPGQKASIKIDTYPGSAFKGRVASVSPGTGTQFSLLPAENATGNWVKIVQRLPVRVELEQLDPARPLRGGLSASVSVDTQHRRHVFGSADAADPTAASDSP